MLTWFEFTQDSEGKFHFIIRQRNKRVAMPQEDAIRFAELVFKIVDASNRNLIGPNINKYGPFTKEEIEGESK